MKQPRYAIHRIVFDEPISIRNAIPMINWLKENGLYSRTSVQYSGLKLTAMAFDSRDDAMMFKLVWGGQ